MIDGLEWNGAPAPTAEEVRLAEIERKYKEDIKYICKQVGIKTPEEIKREQWEKDNFFDKETQTTRKMRLEAIEKYRDPICQNINDELVYIGNCSDVQEYHTDTQVHIVYTSWHGPSWNICFWNLYIPAILDCKK